MNAINVPIVGSTLYTKGDRIVDEQPNCYCFLSLNRSS
jgi:hypothetical protein